jgi:hypothetical protein
MCKNIRSSLIHNTQKRPKTKIKTNTNSHDQDFKNKKDRLPINALDEESTSIQNNSSFTSRKKKGIYKQYRSSTQKRYTGQQFS